MKNEGTIGPPVADVVEDLIELAVRLELEVSKREALAGRLDALTNDTRSRQFNASYRKLAFAIRDADQRIKLLIQSLEKITIGDFIYQASYQLSGDR